ncbi:MAG: methyltransferase domain-containing protein [Desulfobacteraceae bacterium]|nr:methyltransferase domain-containing protein [Desulfobacteraceae bacterium]
MKKWLQEHLICPECIESETALMLEIKKENTDEILEGKFNCPNCESNYLIHNGIAVIVPQKTLPHVEDDRGYNSKNMLSAYLWSHYSEYFNGPNATDAYQKWASHFEKADGWALDIGCSVGRLSFEMSKTHTHVIGIDTSLSFVKQARQLLLEKHLEFDLIVEGNITQNRSCKLSSEYNFSTTEFIVADAMALPFRSNLFSTAASVNILEKVPHPIQHLREVNRMLQKKHARFLFSDPFSWDESVSAPDLWLSGRNKGPNKGLGMENICRLMEGKNAIFDPAFTIQEKGDVLWKIRKTQNLWEYITSQFIVGKRGQI